MEKTRDPESDLDEPNLCDPRLLEPPARGIITMYVAPGVSSSIEPEEVIRGDDESDEAYAKRQTLAVALWSIADNAGTMTDG
jgi:hypothetical protein